MLKSYCIKVLLFVSICSFFSLKEVNAASISEGGSTSTTKTVLGKATKSTPAIFASKLITGTSSYVYNQSGSSTINDGWIDVAGYKNKQFAISVPSYSSGTIAARIEVISGSSTLNSQSSLTYFTGTTSIGSSIIVSDTASLCRLGLIISSPTGSGSVSASGYFEE